MTCLDCAGTRAVPDDRSGGYAPCPSCVIEATTTFASWRTCLTTSRATPAQNPSPIPPWGRASSISKENHVQRELDLAQH